MKALTLFAVVSIAILTGPMTALAWNPLRSENSNVKKGNTLMSKHQYSDALQAYDKAAEKLPDTPGIQLNRGLALFGEDQTDSAKEAFLQAADPSFPVPLRADAYYDLGVAFATQGDTLAEQKEHDKAIAQYREAVDAFKRSLRIQPADRNAAWNLEYAQARIVEQEQQQQDEQQQTARRATTTARRAATTARRAATTARRAATTAKRATTAARRATTTAARRAAAVSGRKQATARRAATTAKRATTAASGHRRRRGGNSSNP